jgi:hypothetical protein
MEAGALKQPSGDVSKQKNVLLNGEKTIRRNIGSSIFGISTRTEKSYGPMRSEESNLAKIKEQRNTATATSSASPWKTGIESGRAKVSDVPSAGVSSIQRSATISTTVIGPKSFVESFARHAIECLDYSKTIQNYSLQRQNI